MLRILKDAEWRKIGITQSLGWEHYEVHGKFPKGIECMTFSIEKSLIRYGLSAPEPHILLFRREKDFQEKVGEAEVLL